MIYYLVFSSCSVFIYYLHSRSKSILYKDKRGNEIIFLISVLPLIFLSSLRSLTVGTDTTAYVSFFNRINTLDDIKTYYDMVGEPSFWLLCYIIKQTSNEYYVFLGSITLIVTAIYSYSIDKICKYKFFSFFLLLFVGPYFFHFNGVRQSVAIALFFLSFKYVLEQKYVKYFLIIALGFTFHKSMLVCLPLYFILHNGVSRRSVLLVLIFFLIAMLSFSTLFQMVSIVDERYLEHGKANDVSGGVVTTIVSSVFLLWFLILRKLNDIKSNQYDIALFLYLIGVLISVISVVQKVDPSGLQRLSLYFTQFQVVLFPISIMSIREHSLKLIVLFFSFAFYILYFVLTVGALNNLVPFIVNPIFL